MGSKQPHTPPPHRTRIPSGDRMRGRGRGLGGLGEGDEVREVLGVGAGAHDPGHGVREAQAPHQLDVEVDGELVPQVVGRPHATRGRRGEPVRTPLGGGRGGGSGDVRCRVERRYAVFCF